MYSEKLLKILQHVLKLVRKENNSDNSEQPTITEPNTSRFEASSIGQNGKFFSVQQQKSILDFMKAAKNLVTLRPLKIIPEQTSELPAPSCSIQESVSTNEFHPASLSLLQQSAVPEPQMLSLPDLTEKQTFQQLLSLSIQTLLLCVKKLKTQENPEQCMEFEESSESEPRTEYVEQIEVQIETNVEEKICFVKEELNNSHLRNELASSSNTLPIDIDQPINFIKTRSKRMFAETKEEILPYLRKNRQTPKTNKKKYCIRCGLKVAQTTKKSEVPANSSNLEKTQDSSSILPTEEKNSFRFDVVPRRR